MEKFNDNTIIATGLEINNSGDFVHIQPDNKRVMLWINHSWHWKHNKKHFAPIVEVFDTKQEYSTHKIKGKDVYFSLIKINGKFSFESFINNFIELEVLNNEEN